MTDETLRVLRVIDGTTVDGPGFRTSIYLAGCTHHCPGCHNPESWAPLGGEEMSVGELMDRIEANDMDVTFSGGDPMYQAQALLPLVKAIKAHGRNIWCFTGYTYEQAEAQQDMARVLDYVDVLVDGPFIERLRDTSLLFRGSSNQRLIKIDPSRSAGRIILWEPEF
ncbi:MAG: anaerobic ribonucleoside-triphosphate reductase activating protein [Muribaculaceae bacterium]|nr:anaerobic ribonucleoside-triphosphate reductase activating protein [Muribaculaceae bacterium]